ncbi:MAG: hypothetical protein DI536_16410 [Archangium gephyra]|uniref:Glycosyltransferase RgtA/B/C/D-like domain-containing protein n=1 Tax=Archangium gephyra TaxID=48 RepID=A0A2W5TF99_9BACT|nr:MAG: hypothetical protein DI536_16410 [Archangium gephyra]
MHAWIEENAHVTILRSAVAPRDCFGQAHPVSGRVFSVAALVFGLTTFTVYAVAPQRVQSDSIWSIPLALTLLQDGSLTLDRYADTCARVPHGCSTLNGHLRPEFPIATSLIAAIPLALVEGVVHVWPWPNRAFERWETHAHARGDITLDFFDVTENLIASGVVALAAVFFFLAALRRLGTVRGALMAAVVFAFGTSLFSTASRVLWQHGPALLFATIALWLSLRVSTRRGLLLLGVCLGAAWVCRPTMALFGLAMCWPLWCTHRWVNHCRRTSPRRGSVRRRSGKRSPEIW